MAIPEALDADAYPEFSDRQRVAFPVVLAAPTLRAGLEAAELSRSSWYRWLSEPRINEAWRRLQRDAFAEALADLRGAARFAVSGLLALVTSKNEQVKLLACKEILALAIKTAEMDELVLRIERIETALQPLIEQAKL